MQLDELIAGLALTRRRGSADAAVTGLTDDSRDVAPGWLFVARPGAGGDALRFVPAAIEAGAAALLLPAMDERAIDRLDVPEGVAVLIAEPGLAVDQRLCGELAERFYGEPSKKLKLIGVTGTNGKTTTVTLAKHLLESVGHKCGLIGTVELDTGSADGPRPATLTTPGAIELSRLLAEMVANGCGACVMEVSSHALHQGRAEALRFAAAAFTNLTQDHLDYHGTMQAYADAKAILFEGLDEDAVAVLNADDAFAPRMASGCAASILFSVVVSGDDDAPASQQQPPADRCFVTPITLTPASSEAQYVGPWGRFTATLPMPGAHNLSNALQAALLAHAAGDLTDAQLQRGLETCKPVPGRLEPVGPDWPNPKSEIRWLRQRQQTLNPKSPHPTVLVDYAHTPDALENVGRTLRELTQQTGGRLITVFGCGGDRDRAKRPLMAQAAQQYADVVILTSDNPRTEDPRQIIRDAQAGFGLTSEPQSEIRNPKSEIHVIADRAQAIRFAINLANENDTVLIAGKGHEDYQILGTEKVHFDDREHAAAALREKLNSTP